MDDSYEQKHGLSGKLVKCNYQMQPSSASLLSVSVFLVDIIILCFLPEVFKGIICIGAWIGLSLVSAQHLLQPF